MRTAPNKITLTPEQITYLKANFHSKTNQQLAEALGLKITMLRTRCYEMGLKRFEMEYWTKEQITYLKRYYRTIGDTELASLFSKKWHKNKGWSKKHIEKKRRYLKLKRTPHQRAAIKQRNISKGMFKNCVVNSWITRGGASPELTVRIWPVANIKHKHIKVNGKFIKLAKYNWEQFHEKKVRKGYCIVFKDGDPMNCNPKNLQRITRKENVLRNSTQYHKLSEQTKRIIQLNNKLKKIVKNGNSTQKSA